MKPKVTIRQTSDDVLILEQDGSPGTPERIAHFLASFVKEALENGADCAGGSAGRDGSVMVTQTNGTDATNTMRKVAERLFGRIIDHTRPD